MVSAKNVVSWAAVAGMLAALLFAWLLIRVTVDGWPALSSDAVLFVPAASRIADAEGWLFGVYTRLFLAREPHSWAFDLHGQIYPWLLAKLARDGSYLAIHAAACWIAAATALLGYLALWMRLRAGGWRDWPASAAAFVLAAALAMISFAYVGRPEQLVPLLSCLCLGLRAHPSLRRSAAFYGLEVGLIAACSPAPAVLAGLIYANVVLLESPERELFLRWTKLLIAAAMGWALLVWTISPYSPLAVLLNTLNEAGSAHGAAPLGRRIALQMLAFRPDLPWVGLGFAALFCTLIAAHLATPMTHLKRTLGIALLALLSALVYLLALRTYTSQYVLVALSGLMMGVVLTEASPLKPRWTQALAVIAMALPAAGIAHFLERQQDLQRWGDSRSNVAAQVAELLQNAGPLDRIVFPDGELALMVLEDRPRRMLSVTNFSPELLNRVEKALEVKVRWVFVPVHLAPEAPLGFRYLTTFSRQPERRDWQPNGYGVHVFERR